MDDSEALRHRVNTDKSLRKILFGHQTDLYLDKLNKVFIIQQARRVLSISQKDIASIVASQVIPKINNSLGTDKRDFFVQLGTFHGVSFRTYDERNYSLSMVPTSITNAKDGDEWKAPPILAPKALRFPSGEGVIFLDTLIFLTTSFYVDRKIPSLILGTFLGPKCLAFS